MASNETGTSATSSVMQDPSQPLAGNAADPAAGKRTGWPTWLSVLLLVVPVLIAYVPAMRADFIWDDDKYVYETDQHLIVPAEGSDETRLDCLKRIWFTNAAPQYYPLVFTTFWIEHALWGFDPTGYHITNILMHVITTVLVWRVLRNLGVPGAWAVAAIFGLHPVCVETVAWITERKNTMSAMFYMIAALCYLKFGEGKSWGFYVLAVGAFLLALFSKTVTCTLPIIVLLVFWLKGRRIRSSALLGLVPLLLVGLFFARLTGWYEFHKNNPDYWEPMPITKAVRLAWTESAEERDRSGYGLTPPQRIIIASRALLFYAQKAIVPYPQAFFYERWDPKTELDPSLLFNYWPVALCAFLAATVVVLGVVVHRGVFIAASYFVITIFPALGLVDLWPMRYSFVADHFEYLAMLGILALAVAAVHRFFRPIGGAPLRIFNGANAPAGLLTLIVLIVFGAATFARAKVFRNPETLWTDTIAKTPNSWAARNNLGVWYAEHGRDAEAIDQFEAILAGEPDFLKTYQNLGNLYGRQRRFAEAERLFREALRRAPNDPHLGLILAKTIMNQGPERYEDADAAFAEAAKVAPRSAQVFQSWAELLERMGRSEEAAQMAQHAAALRAGQISSGGRTQIGATQRGDANAPIDLGDARTPTERRQKYLDLFDEAVARREYALAERIVQAGVQEVPQSSGLWKRVGLLLAASPLENQRNPDKAVALAERLRADLARMNRLDADTLYVLAAAYSNVGRFEDAVATAREGLKLANTETTKARLELELRFFARYQAYRLPLPGEGGENSPP
jgi:tetratricopeptide (TPR) repeat protein